MGVGENPVEELLLLHLILCTVYQKDQTGEIIREQTLKNTEATRTHTNEIRDLCVHTPVMKLGGKFACQALFHQDMSFIGTYNPFPLELWQQRHELG